MRGPSAAHGQEPAVARGRADAHVFERSDERAQPVRAWPRVRVNEDEDFARRVGGGDACAQVVNLLPACVRAARDDEARARRAAPRELAAQAFGDGERGVVRAVGDEDEFVSRVVLREERGEVFAQALIHAAARHEDGGAGHVERSLRLKLAPEEREPAHAAAQRDETLQDDERGEEIEDQHPRSAVARRAEKAAGAPRAALT